MTPTEKSVYNETDIKTKRQQYQERHKEAIKSIQKRTKIDYNHVGRSEAKTYFILLLCRVGFDTKKVSDAHGKAINLRITYYS